MKQEKRERTGDNLEVMAMAVLILSLFGAFALFSRASGMYDKVTQQTFYTYATVLVIFGGLQYLPLKGFGKIVSYCIAKHRMMEDRASTGDDEIPAE